MENEKLYCVNAVHNLSVNSRGTCKPCCMIDGETKGRVIDTPIETLWNEKYFIEIRQAFDNNEKHPACNKCWNEEAAGRRSKRLRDNDRFKFEETDYIKTLELNMGNTCNIKCRTCHPQSSSLWAREFYDTEPFIKKEKTYKEFLIESKIYNDCWDDDSMLWAELDKITKDVEHIDFYGGEPWLLKKQWNLLENCVKNGWSKNMSLHYNTNGTQWKEDQIAMFDHFKHVDIGFSIDGVGPQFEFMRHLAVWDEVKVNLQKAKEWGSNRPNALVGLCHTISALNVYYIPEFLEYFGPEWHTYLNLVHWPRYYNIQIFPDSIKQIICDRLESIDKRHEQAWHQLPGIIQFIKDGKFDPYYWEQFKKEIDVHDEYRNENYYETFKEFGEIIRNYK